MLFAPEIQVQQEQHEKDLKEARTFFEGMPDNGIVIHGGVQEYAKAKKHKGLKYDSACYYYISKPNELAREDDIITIYKSAIAGIGDVSGYAFGETTTIFSERANPNMLADEYLNPKVIYKNRPELNPSFLCYEAPKEVFDQFDGIVRTFPQEIRVSDYPVDASNLLFEVTMNYGELSKFPAINEAIGGFKSKILERIKSKDFVKEIPPSNFQLEKDGRYLSIPDLITELLSKSSNDPVYAEAIARAKQAGVDIKEYENTVNFLISKGMLTQAELAQSKNPLAIFELVGRRQQIENNIATYGQEVTHQKVQRMVGEGETKRFKKEISIIQSIKIAWEYRRKYPKTFIGLIAYGSLTDKYKPDSPDLDVKVIIKTPDLDDIDHYEDESDILNSMEHTVPAQTGKRCEPTILYLSDLEDAYDQVQKGEIPTSFLAKNNVIDKRCAPIIFGLKNIKMFRKVFAEQLRQIQTNFKRPEILTQ